MTKYEDFSFSPGQFFDKNYIRTAIAKSLKIPVEEVKSFKIVKKSIDARKDVKYRVRIMIAMPGQKLPETVLEFKFDDVSRSKNIVIVGAGPAGYFAALKCLLTGYKPIVIERGKPVEKRKLDIAIINKGKEIVQESNFVFGEGGAGTYSDGKLYTRSKKRGSVNEVLQLLRYFGASEEILIDSQPHIGTDKLPGILQNIRNKIIDCGGEIHFNTKVTGLLTKNSEITGVKTFCGREFVAENVILATGHSARDVYYFLDEQNISLESKDFAAGVRVEHPQSLIDKIQYKKSADEKLLPPASYKIVRQIEGRGVYSFCMCPGGIIVPAMTEKEEIVVNGMSNSRRNSGFANSGIVTEIRASDLKEYAGYGKFAGLEFQKSLEKMAYLNAGRDFSAPAQRLTDFVNGKQSSSLPTSSYNPGLTTSPLHFWLPSFMASTLRKAFGEFDKMLRGYLTEDAVLVGVESRTSSPLKIVRNKITGEQTDVKGLYPCGEGAGYAGGIVSAAIDGINAVTNIAAAK